MMTTFQNTDHHASRRLSRPVVPLVVLIAGLVVYGVFAPQWLEPVYERFGADMGSEANIVEYLGFQLWLFAVPIAVILALIGGSLATTADRGRAWLFGLGGISLVIVPIIVGAIVDRTYGWLFGAGGTVIAVLSLMTAWSWAGMRSRLPSNRRLAADVRMGGYMGFAFASWFTCGLFALPVYALDPSKMIAYDTTTYAIPMAYAMMSFFLVGWILTYTSFVLERRYSDRYPKVAADLVDDVASDDATKDGELVGLR